MTGSGAHPASYLVGTGVTSSGGGGGGGAGVLSKPLYNTLGRV